MSDTSIRNLACAILLQAAKDYCNPKATDEKKKEILADLRSKRMDFITQGTSRVVAEQLVSHPEEIAERLRQNCEKGELI